MSATESELDPHRDLDLALQTAASVQASIRHADAKARTLLAATGGLALVVVDHASGLLRQGSAVLAPTVALLCGLAVTTWQLASAIAPRVVGTQGHNRFAFPSLALSGRRPETAGIRRNRDEAWDLVAALSRIALVKHSRVRRSLPTLALTATATVTLLLIAALA